VIVLAKTAARVAVPAIIGTVLVGSLVLPAVLADEETGLGPGLIGAALLLSPYLILSLAGVRTPTVAWLTVLGLLVGSTVLGLLTAGSSSTGLVFLWLVPAQWGCCHGRRRCWGTGRSGAPRADDRDLTSDNRARRGRAGARLRLSVSRADPGCRRVAAWIGGDRHRNPPRPSHEGPGAREPHSLRRAYLATSLR